MVNDTLSIIPICPLSLPEMASQVQQAPRSGNMGCLGGTRHTQSGSGA